MSESENMFDIADQRLQAIREAQEAYQREIGRKCDWDDPGDAASYRRWRIDRNRKEKIPGDCVCPECRRRVPDARRWVVKRQIAVCRSCYQLRIMGIGANDEVINLDPLFGEELIIRVPVDGRGLIEAREKSGLSRRSFAEKVGWSYERQRDLEYGRVKSLDLETAHGILEVLSEFRILTDDDLPGGN